VEIGADMVEPHIDEDAEELPVVSGMPEGSDAAHIGGKVALGGLRQRVPDEVGNGTEGKAERGHFDHPLVLASDIAPIFGMVWVCAVDEAVAEECPVIEVRSALAERHEAPKRASEAFEVGRSPIEGCRGGAQPNAGASLGEIRKQRIEEVAERRFDVAARLQRIARHGIGGGGIVDHRRSSEGGRSTSGCDNQALPALSWPSRGASFRADPVFEEASMCRNIKLLFNF